MATEPRLLECSRTRTGPEARHLRAIGEEDALCGARDQEGAGAGRWSSLLAWPTCRRCRALAEEMGPHPEQADGAPIALERVRQLAMFGGGAW